METKPHIIIPVRNRKNVTLSCLNMLRPLLGDGWQVVVIDDGSTDGTAQAIAEEFPVVTVLPGSGDLFWTGAMELGMRHAIRHGAECCVWLNDDVTILPEAIERVTAMAMERNCMVSGQGKIHLENGSTWFFPATKWSRKGLNNIPVDDSWREPYPVDCCRGNLVAIPQSIVETIGYPDGRNIPHVGGDTDYSLRATRAGFTCLVDPLAEFLEEENIHTDNRSWLLDDRSPGEILRKSLAKRGILYPRMQFTYQTRHWGLRGLCRATLKYPRLAALLAMKTLLPKRLLLRMFARHSHAYQCYAIRGIR